VILSKKTAGLVGKMESSGLSSIVYIFSNQYYVRSFGVSVRQWEFPQDASSNGENHEIPWGLGVFPLTFQTKQHTYPGDTLRDTWFYRENRIYIWTMPKMGKTMLNNANTENTKT